MRFSKKQITNAGKALISAKSKEEIEIALETLNLWRTDHLHPLNVMRKSLEKLMVDNQIEPILVSQRLKRLSSIEYKLDLNDNMGLGGMQDIGGYRAVLKDTKDLIKLKTIIENNKQYHRLRKTRDYTDEPKDSGYRSIHYVYEYKSRSKYYNGLQLELQIRTKLQHNWATAVETAGILTKTSLKSSQGPDDWLDFFKIVSSLFAIKENMAVLKQHKNYTMEELMKMCYNMTAKLNIIIILKGLRISAKQIEGKKSGDYYLININIVKKNVQIVSFKKSEFELATELYIKLEKEINENENAVVLVSASSILSLKKAYPSYFLDTSEFINALEKINSNCEKLELIRK
ncbi:RelA/SpoT domain-containing protein [Acetobacteroides hydrogenigenes]|uniref:PpGpp synthetase/RelA/SpoT-type nucleotidyltransferase n=1 Tax=Acetobacteroides hydrogenigenes TaxID=979970 RepID=A0A4R2EWC0_9BACT|nr:RelA/SpoT domain-containing protein [Acetobacteroides hydrogenigenes]TCN68989.1 ppGpp synthetase/RelA/SpoT-type nucleotidyltransferase [Acetobacteroides hydrogenigenes]